MTTRVLIMSMPSQQPDREVHVHVEHRDAQGHFYGHRTLVLQHGEVVELHIPEGVQLAVHEHAKAPLRAAA